MQAVSPMFKPAQHVEREHFPALVEDIGEDPARFLDNSEDGSKRELILARIRGIDRFQVLNAWLAIERRLNGGRRVVVDAIEERRAYLEEHGERELQGLGHDELQALALEAVDDDQEEDVEPAWRHDSCGGTDVERESSRTWFCNECEQRTNRVEAVDEMEPELVADGGNKTSGSYRRVKATYSQGGTLHVMRSGEEVTVFPDLSEKLQALCGGWLLGPYLPTEKIGIEKFKRDFCSTCEERVKEWPDDAIPREIRAAWQEKERSLHTDSSRGELDGPDGEGST